MAIKLIHGDASDFNFEADLILTDPPFQMKGKELADIIDGYDSNHLVLICSMRQVLEFFKFTTSDWELSFQLVLELRTPNRPIHYHLPAYNHCLVCYFIRNNKKSRFNRKDCLRADTNEKSYFPTLIYAPRGERRELHGHAKPQQAIQDILSCFKVKNVVDMFAGSCTTGLACLELNLDCILIEKSKEHYENAKQTFEFLGEKV